MAVEILSAGAAGKAIVRTKLTPGLKRRESLIALGGSPSRGASISASAVPHRGNIESYAEESKGTTANSIRHTSLLVSETSVGLTFSNVCC